MSKTPDTPIGSTRDRYLVILAGVVAGYLVGYLLETRLGWTGAEIVTMPVGGLLAGVVARFTLARFQEPPGHGSSRRPR
jgi:hypothetical protein